MTRHLFIFLGTFVLGAVIALGVRTARHQPATAPAAPAGVGEYAPQVTNAPGTGHAAHPAPSAAPAGKTAPGQPVNSVCAICGMPVDPKLPTVEYQGQTIGFGCKLCPPKFKAEPDKYGPLYLRNEVIKR